MDALTTVLPIILSLVIMEGLLSVDNAMVLAAMVRHLGEREQKLALRAGLIGAYVLRIVALLFASFLIANAWIRILGAAYLIYLMCKHVGLGGARKDAKADPASLAEAGFWATVIKVEMVDLSFAIDNVIAAVAISPQFWVVVAGVLIGMAAMRFVAGFFVGLMKKFPALEPASYIVVGYVGVQLLVEQLFHVEVHESLKFGIIIALIASVLAYDRFTILQRICGPFFRLVGYPMGFFARLVDLCFRPFMWLFRLVFSKRRQE